MIVMSSKIPIKEIIIPPNKMPLKFSSAVSPNIKNLASSVERPVSEDSLVKSNVIMAAKASVIKLDEAARWAFLLNPWDR